MKTFIIHMQLLLLLFFFRQNAMSQQLNSSSLFDMYGVLHNPAAAGTNPFTVVGATYKSQWQSMPGSPKTALVFASMPMNKLNIGVGGYLFSDVTGPTRRTGMEMAYAYHIKSSSGNIFSLGLEGRFQQYSIDRAKLENSLGANDPVLSGEESKIKGDLGFGIQYKTDKILIGLSGSQLVQSKFNEYGNIGTEATASKNYRHFYLQSSYKIDVDDATSVIPNVMGVYIPNAPGEFAGGVRVVHRNLFWYGLTWKVKQSWMVSAGLKIAERLNVGYSFDIYATPLDVFSGGSNGNELMLRYEFLK
jgi:type IX secretion system PorP/SprF family membrane protein